MLGMIARRLLALIPVLFVVFLLVELVPGDAATSVAGGANATEEKVADVRADLGLDRPVQDFFTDAKSPSALIPLRRAGLDKVTRNLQLGSIGDTCQYDDPKLNACIAKLKELGAGSKEYEQTWQAMDEYIVKNALHQFLIWSPAVNAYNPDEVTKVAYAPDVHGQLRFDAFKTQVKS